MALAANIGLSGGIVGLTYALAIRLPGNTARHYWPMLPAFLLMLYVSLLTFGARGSSTVIHFPIPSTPKPPHH